MSLFYLTTMMHHLLKAKSSAGHGVHSPFIYDFLRETVRRRTEPELVDVAEKLRAEMLSEKDMLYEKKRKEEQVMASRIRSLVKVAIPPCQIELLARIAASECSGTTPDDGLVVELGTSLGISTLCLAMAAQQNNIITIEPSREIAEIASVNFKRAAINNIILLNEDILKSLKQLQQEEKKVRFAFINGRSINGKLIDYFNSVLEIGSGTLTVLIDGIHLNRSLYDGWEEISRQVSVRDVSMETNSFGIVFIRKSITPGVYKIRC